MNENKIDALETSDGVTLGEEVNTAALTAETKIEFQPENFVKNLNYMGQGMLGIFIVIGIIALVTVTLSKISGKNKE